MLGAVKCVAFKCENVCCNAMMVIEEGGSGAYRPSLAMQTQNDQVLELEAVLMPNLNPAGCGRS